MRDKVDVLIPFKPDGAERDRIFRWVHNRWTTIFPWVNVIVGEDDSTPFNRARARNIAFNNSTADYLVIADADTFAPRKTLEQAFMLLFENRRDWVFPFSVYYNANKEYAEFVLNQDVDYDPVEEEISYDHRLTDSDSAFLMLSREAYECVNGYDERFVGWGGEDRAFRASLDVLWGGHRRVSGYCVHIWHPRDLDFEQPDWPQNRVLMQRYEKARRVEDMIRVRFG